MSKKRPKGRPEPLGALLHNTLNGTKLGERLKELEIWRSWGDIVGPDIARRTRPLRMSGGVLTVVVASAPWMQQLTFMKSDLRTRLNSCLGDELITDILFRSGPVSEKQSDANNETVKKRDLSDSERLLIEQQVKDIVDPEIREQFKKLMENHYRCSV